MPNRSLKTLLLAGCGAGVLLAASTAANAGGFAVREQSAWGEGSSYAGVAAGGSLSAMFWNPATMTQMPGIQSESVVSVILPYSREYTQCCRKHAGRARRHGQYRQRCLCTVQLFFLSDQSEPLGRVVGERTLRAVGGFPEFMGRP